VLFKTYFGSYSLSFNNNVIKQIQYFVSVRGPGWLNELGSWIT